MSDNPVSNPSSIELSDSERIAALESQVVRVTNVTNVLIAEVFRLTAENATLREAVSEIFHAPLALNRH